MPAWLVWYSGTYTEIKMFFGILAGISIVLTVVNVTSVDKRISKSTILLYVIGCIALLGLAFLLPDGRTAISMYNAF
mgnify:CR=1 FL=1